MKLCEKEYGKEGKSNGLIQKEKNRGNQEAYMKKEKKKMGVRDAFCWALGTGGNNMYTTLIGTYLTGYYTDTAGIAVAAIGTMMLFSRIFDGITDIAMGAIVDKTRTKMGKARPWILLSAPLFLILLFLTVSVPQGMQENFKLVYAYITYILLNCFVNTMYFVAHNALLARISLDPNDRMKATAMSQIVSSITTLVATIIINTIIQHVNWSVAGIILGGLIAATILIEFFGTEERVGNSTESEVQENQNEGDLKESLSALFKNKYFYILTVAMIMIYIANQGAQTATFYYVSYVLKDLNWITVMMACASLAMFVINLVNPVLVKRYSKRVIAMIGAAVNAAGFLVIAAFGNGVAVLVLSNLLRGAGIGIMFPCIMAFAADVVDYGDWKFGIRSEGLINSCASMGNKIGVGLGAAMVAWILAKGGYDGTKAVQSASAIGAINFTFIWLSVILTVFMVILFGFLDLEKYKDQVQKDLAKRHSRAEENNH